MLVYVKYVAIHMQHTSRYTSSILVNMCNMRGNIHISYGIIFIQYKKKYIFNLWDIIHIVYKVVILGIRRLTGGHRRRAGGRSYPLRWARTRRTKHIL
jgi:hypothetical protein